MAGLLQGAKAGHTVKIRMLQKGVSLWKNSSAVSAPGGRKAWLKKISFTLLLTPEPGTIPAAANPIW